MIHIREDVLSSASVPPARNDNDHPPPKTRRTVIITSIGSTLTALAGFGVGVSAGAWEWRNKISAGVQTGSTWIEGRESHDKAQQQALADIKQQLAEQAKQMKLVLERVNALVRASRS